MGVKRTEDSGRKDSRGHRIMVSPTKGKTPSSSKVGGTVSTVLNDFSSTDEPVFIGPMGVTGRYGDYYDKDGDKLERLKELELTHQDWEFDIIGVWKDKDGNYFMSTDSGCSCPMPWENDTAEQLTGPLTAEQTREEVQSLVSHKVEARPDEVKEFLSQIK